MSSIPLFTPLLVYVWGIQKGMCLEAVVTAGYTISIVTSNNYLARAEQGLENKRAQEHSAFS